MNDRPNAAIMERLGQLEIRLARTRTTMVIGVLVAACAFAMGSMQAPPERAEKVVTATRFILVDEKGNERAVLGFKNGSPALRMFGR